MNFHITKTAAILIMLFNGTDIFPQDYWIQNASPTTKYLRSVFFTDSLNGWVSGDSGLIIHTTNKGLSWTEQHTGLVREIKSLCFINGSTGFALSWEFNPVPPGFYGTRILSTTNGGNNWENYLYPDTNLFLNTIYFRDAVNGYMAGSEGKIYYTTNAGKSWQRTSIDSSLIFNLPVERIKFADNLTGFATGGAFDIAGMIWKSTNGGLNWRSEIVGPEPVKDLYIFDSENVFCVGGDFEYGPSSVVSSNAGVNWTYTEFGIIGIANSVDFRTDEEGWISLGIVDTFLLSTDYGLKWQMVPSPGGALIYDLQFVDNRNGWAVGNNGVILRYNSELIGINNTATEIPDVLILQQNYPNPFNPFTKISYELKHSANVRLEIFNTQGKSVKVIPEEIKSSGSHEFTLRADDLSSGVYFVKLTAEFGNFSSSQSRSIKVILMK